MAKIKAVDQAVVITSTLTNEEVAKATQYFPEALVLKEKNEDGKMKPIFAIDLGFEPVATKHGIVFVKGEKTEKASVTLQIPKLSKSKRVEFVKDNYGTCLMNLNKLEAQYAEQAKAFDKAYAELDKDIDVE